MRAPRLTIIGAGPAGLSGAIYGASEGLAVTVIDPHPARGGQAATAIHIRNLLGYPRGISGRDLMARAYHQARSFGVRFEADRAVRLARNGVLHVQLASGRTIESDVVLLALGVHWRRLDVPGADTTYGVFYGVDRDRLPEWNGKHVAVIGGANSAGQAAVSFAEHGARVDVLSRSPLTKGMSAYLIQDLETSPAVTIHERVTPTAFEQIDGNRVRLDTPAGALDYDGVFLFIGADPPTGWLALDKDARGFLLCGHGAYPAQCSLPGVFAAGDVRSGSTKRVGAAIGDAAAAVAQIHAFLAGS